MSIYMQKGVVVVPMGASGALEDIPKSPGVYAYYLSFISRRSLGLFQGASFTDTEDYPLEMLSAQQAWPGRPSTSS